MSRLASPIPAANASGVGSRRWLELPGVLGVIAFAHTLLLAPLSLELRLLGALLLFVALPGHLLVQAAFTGPQPEPLERHLLALGCGYVLAAFLALGLYTLFRPLHGLHLIAAADVVNAALLLLGLARGARLLPRLSRPTWQVLAVLVVAAPFRLFNLGWSEFQGDEAEVVLRSFALLQGHADALLVHAKPPGEILLHALVAGVLGGVTELTSRLPFTLAGLAGVLAAYRLGRMLFGWRAGLTAGLLLAVNGYFVAFGRILQYPSVALLLETMAVLCLVRFRHSPRGGYAVVGALLLVGSALTALSAVFLLPVAALALWPRAFGPGRVPWRELAFWLWPLVPLTAAAVYALVTPGERLALDLRPVLADVAARFGGSLPHFNLKPFVLSVSHYNSSLYLLGVGILVLIAGGASAGLLRGLVNKADLGRRRLGWYLTLVWLAGPLLTHTFLVRLPLTHWREVFPGLVLVAGATAAGLYARLADGRLRAVAMLAGGLFVAATGHYVYTAWIQPWPEYQDMYPLYRHPLDWAGVQSQPPGGGTFGAAHRHGWKVAGWLIANGELPAAYATNDYSARVAWYLKQPAVCARDAAVYLGVGRSPRDRKAVEDGEGMAYFAPGARVQVDGRPTLAFLFRNPPQSSLGSYQADDYDWRFDRELSSPWAALPDYGRSVDKTPSCPNGW